MTAPAGIAALADTEVGLACRGLAARATSFVRRAFSPTTTAYKATEAQAVIAETRGAAWEAEYVFEGNKCIYDHLQDTFEIAVENAREDYGVPKNAWKKDDPI